MTTMKKLLSLRGLVLLFASSLLAVFFTLAFFIVHRSVPRVLLPSEEKYFTRQVDVVQGLFSSAMHDMLRSARLIALWPDAASLARGESEVRSSVLAAFAVAEMPGYDVDVILITDSAGNVTFSLDSSGTSDRHAALARRFNDIEDQAGPERDFEARKNARTGILIQGDTPYLLAAAPVMDPESAALVGTVILGNILDNEYFQRVTQYRDTIFQLGAPPGGGAERGLLRSGTENASAFFPVTGLDGEVLRLVMTSPRHLYRDGKAAMENAVTLLVIVAFLFALSLYWGIGRFLLRPVEKLSSDIRGVADKGALDGASYSSIRDFRELCDAINDMVRRLDQSKISLDVMQRILDTMDAIVYVSDLETNEFLFANSKAREVFGAYGEIVGKKCWEVLHPDMTERCDFCPIPFLERDESLSSGPFVWEDQHPETRRFYRVMDSLIEWEGGKKAHLQHRMDITETRFTEEALTRRLEQQELMLSMSRSFITEEDMPARINRALSMAGEFMEISKILVARLNEETHTLDAAFEWFNAAHGFIKPEGTTSLPFHKGAIEYDAFYEGDTPYLAFDDISGKPELAYAASHGIQSLVGMPIHVEGRFWGLLSFNECARKRKWTESDIQLAHMVHNIISGAVARNIIEEELLRMSSIVRSASQCIAYIAPDGKFEYFNPALPATVGYSAAELDAAGIGLVLPRAIYAHTMRHIIPKVLRDGEGEFEVPFIRKNGEVLTMSLSAFKTESRGDRANGGVGAIAQDITEKRRLEKELVAAKELAEKSSMAKSEFLSRMSHEMRTPLNAVIGMTSIGMAAKDLEKKEYCLTKIDDASKHLLGVINDILDMSKIEASKFELSFTEFDLEKMFMRVCNVVNFRVDEKKQILNVSIDRNLPYMIVSDEQRLTQVITNLLSNAVKFTPEQGSVTLSAEKTAEKDGLCTILVRVTDTGIGISQENQSRLFRSFEQADGGIARKFGGTGLGLAISKSIVSLLGGEIWVESEEGRGSSFAFTFTAKIGRGRKHKFLSPGTGWGSVRILAVDDAPDVLEYFAAFARERGIECAVASGSGDALALLDKHGDCFFPIIFIDWKMPVMDGIELTRAIRERETARAVHASPAARSRIVMITSAQWNEIEEEARAAGVDSFIAKPLFSSVIEDCINDSLDPGKLRASMAGAIDDGRFAGHRVLLAEDIEINQEIVISLLAHTGLDIDCAENGRVAYEMFAVDPQRYSILFMDIHMPEVDGFEATQRIRNLNVPEAANVPIIAMTANVFREDIEKCMAAGMNDHIGKPVDVDEMIAVLKKYLR